MSSGNSTAAAIASIVLTVALFCVGVWVLVNRQYVVDQLTVWQFTPATEVAELADESSMSEDGRFYFYAATPRLLDERAEFNSSCPRQEESSAILGCYAEGMIHVYDVPDERVDGITTVTAAHEMLHVAYDRLSDDERQRIDRLLEAEYKKLLASGSVEIKSRMEYYARTEPGERNNELHSIIATEVKDISGELERHYQGYFERRSVVVDLHQSYNAKFIALENSSRDLKARLELLSQNIDAMTNQYNADRDTLNADIEAFNARATSGGFTSESQFSSARNSLMARVDTLEQTRQRIDNEIAQYEQQRIAYNETVDESNSLARSLDSTLAPAPSI